MIENTPPAIQTAISANSLPTAPATIDGVPNIPAPTMRPTIIVTASNSVSVCRGAPSSRAALISGMYDLRPVRLSARSAYLRFTDQIEDALSPIRHLDLLRAPLIVSYGTLETPELQRHGRDLVAAVEAIGKPVTHLPAAGYNHFEILETLASPYGLRRRRPCSSRRAISKRASSSSPSWTSASIAFGRTRFTLGPP